MNRRQALQALAAAFLVRTQTTSAEMTRDRSKGVEALQRDWKKLLAPRAPVATDTTPLAKSDEEWRRVLTPAAYDVLRHEGTERPFTSPLNDEHRPGVFACAGCSLPLFTSAMKFDSGTGWPSYFTTIPGVFATKTDHKLIMARTEYHCVK